MDASWYALDLSALVGTFASAAGIYLVLIAVVRLNGLRSFSKMSSYDFAITVAVGSVLASVVLAPAPSLTQGALALAALFGLQHLLSRLRASGGTDALDNPPLLLMRGREVLHENLRAARVTEADLYAKLREANVLGLDQVRAVVMESTGDVSVLHGPTEAFEEAVLRDVRQAPGR